eukprot:scaffold72061_cov51-Attheya_sp.AAC.1
MFGKKKDIEEGKEEVSFLVSTPWHALSVDASIEALKLTPALKGTGLSTKEAEARLAEHGENAMTAKVRKTIWERIWDQVANVLVGILVTVAVVSAIRAITATDSDTIVTNWIQVGLIVGVVTTNTWIGIMQEGSAEKAAEALKNMLSSDARVMRNGKEVMVPATTVVPGDLVMLGLGDRVPADVRMVNVINLACQEAALTGESVPIDKTVDAIPLPENGNADQTPLGDRHNMCFSATLVAQGAGTGLVIATGDFTQIGTINALVNKVATKKTNVLEQIDHISKWLAVFIMIAALCTFLVAYLYTGLEPIDSVTIALVCAVGMIPEGLEAIVTLTYAWAVSNMAKQNAIIRALPAVETLGSVTVICSDKTGTLTKNEMSLTAFRAEHQMNKKTKEIIADGDNVPEPRRGKADRSYGFTIDNLETPAGSVHNAPAVDEDATAGESPSTPFIRSLLSGGVLCSKCVLGENGTRVGEIGNPTELSLLRAAYFSNVEVDDLKKTIPIVAEVPFSSEYKFMATVHEPTLEIDGPSYGTDNLVVHVKGAPDRMVPLCNKQAISGNIADDSAVEDMDARYWTEQIAVLSSHGLRVLALCRGTVPKSEVKQDQQLNRDFVDGRDEPWLTMVGLCAIMDPPRPECVDAIKEAHGAGVRVAMITGDHKDTAIAIGHMLGLVDEEYSTAITGPEIDNMEDDDLRKAVMEYNVFARASPQNKIRIVKALQAEGQVCSMTGDGVNDAPALKAADMGVAMGQEGTDVAREAAEMILADDNFATIVTAVKEGRVVWDNLRKVLLVNTPINNAQGLSVLFGFVFGLDDTPLTAIQVLYSNLICAITLGFVTAIEPAEDGIMTMPPRRVGKRLIGRFLFLRIALATVVLVACVVGSVLWAQDLGYNLNERRSQAMNVLDFCAISVTLSARFSYNSSISKDILFGNEYCWYSVAVVTVLQFAVTYIPGLNETIFSMAPMDGPQWGITFLLMVVVFLIMEAEKALRRNLKARGEDVDDREAWIFDEEVQPTKAGTHFSEGTEVLAAAGELTK